MLSLVIFTVTSTSAMYPIGSEELDPLETMAQDMDDDMAAIQAILAKGVPSKADMQVICQLIADVEGTAADMDEESGILIGLLNDTGDKVLQEIAVKIGQVMAALQANILNYQDCFPLAEQDPAKASDLVDEGRCQIVQLLSLIDDIRTELNL